MSVRAGVNIEDGTEAEIMVFAFACAEVPLRFFGRRIYSSSFGGIQTRRKLRRTRFPGL